MRVDLDNDLKSNIETLRKDFTDSVTDLGRQYRKWLSKRDEYEEFIEYLPKRLMEIPMRYMHQGTYGDRHLYIISKYSIAGVKLMQEIMAEAGWSTDSKITPEPNVWLYYDHPAVKHPFGITINLETSEEPAVGEEVCIVVPIEWEQRLVPTTYDRICPENHPELFRDGVYIGDDLFPAMPKDQDGLKVT